MMGRRWDVARKLFGALVKIDLDPANAHCEHLGNCFPAPRDLAMLFPVPDLDPLEIEFAKYHVCSVTIACNTALV